MHGLMTIDESEEIDDDTNDKNDEDNGKIDNGKRGSKIRKQLKFDDEDINDSHSSSESLSFSNIISLNNYHENSPINPGINGKSIKTFEQLLEEMLMRQQNIPHDHNSQTKPKRPFLRKGSGLRRFQLENCQSNDPTTKLCKIIKDNGNATKQKSQNIIPKRRNTINEHKQKENVPMSKKYHHKKSSFEPKTTDKDINNTSLLKSENFKSTKTPKITNISHSNQIMARNSKQCTKGKDDIIITRNSRIHNNDDTEINDLEHLLKKIEEKRIIITDQLKESDNWIDVSDDEYKENSPKKLLKKSNKNKKKVRLCRSSRVETHKEQSSICLDQPSFGAYSVSLKKQIENLENNLSQLKVHCRNNEQQFHTKCAQKPNDNPNEVILLKDKIETLNNRLKNLESQKYDLITPMNKQKKSSVVERNLTKNFTSHDGLNIAMTKFDTSTMFDFPNGDKMKISNDNTVFYSYANGATQTSFSDGLKIINFPNGQIEKIHKNGIKHITYPDGLQRIINSDSSEEVHLNDGSVLRISNNGTESLELPNGDREIRTNNFKRREYSNGTVKTLYSDGTQETRYINGRLRIKDKNGHLMVDSKMKHLNEFTFQH